MNGSLRIAFKLLVNDRTKFAALLVGITFAVFLIIQMTSVFSGVLSRSSATVTNIGASVWVMDPAVKTVANSIPMPDYVLDAVRSISGVKYAVPLYSGAALVKLTDGAYQPVSVLGLDDATLFGRPALVQGSITNLYADNGFIVVRDAEFSKLENPIIGTTFEINNHRGVIVGIAKVVSSGLFGMPTLYTTYTRALQYIPQSNFSLSFVLVQPKQIVDIPAIQRAVKALGYVALTKAEFKQQIARFYKYETGLGVNLFLITIMSFVVGLSISAQTFYTFVIENLEKFGALKAIGAKNSELVRMILFQAGFTALTGYGLGLGICSLLLLMARMKLPNYAALITFSNLALAFFMVVVIAGISSYVAIHRVLRIQPFDVFRG